MSAVKRTRRRSSGTRQALASQESTRYSSASAAGCSSARRPRPRAPRRPRRGFALAPSPSTASSPSARLSSVTVPPAASIFSRAVAENAVRVTVSFFVSSPYAEQLHVDARDRSDQALRLQRLGRDLRRRRRSALEVADVHRLRRACGTGRSASRPSTSRRAACRRACRAASARPRSRRASSCEPERDFWPLIPRPE